MNELITTNGAQMAMAPVHGGSSLGAVAVASREMAEMQAKVYMAKQFPRDEQESLRRILNACSRESLAKVAVYEYSRGGDVSGPSIRLAETLAQSWGNVDYGFREIECSNGVSKVEAFCWDLETNTRATRTFDVRHERYTRAGVKTLTDPRDIYETVANNGARRLRACILQIIPGDVVESAVDQCRQTQEDSLRKKGGSIKDRIPGMVKQYAELGVTRKMLEAYIGRDLESVTYSQLVKFGNMYRSIKDGIASVEDYFASAMDRVAEKTRKRASAAEVMKQAAEEAPTTEAPTAVEVETAKVDTIPDLV